VKNEPVKPPKETPAKPSGGRAPRWLSSLFNFRFFSDEMPKISPLAVIDPSASIAEDVEIGPFCVIGPDVTLEGGCRLLNSVTIIGKTTIGRDNVFFPNCVIGTYPQDKKFKGAPTELHIGSGNVFREAVTVHIGTEKGGRITRVGNNNMFMINTHIGHDARIGSDCVFANNVMIAGHCVVGDHVNMMGLAGLHHFVTIGRFAYLGGAARIHHDVPPFVKVDGADEIRGLNKVGLARAGYGAEDIKALDSAYRKLFNRKRPLSVVMDELESSSPGLNPYVRELIEFLRRRDLGKHGRYLEGRRGSGEIAAVVAEANAAATAAGVAAAAAGPRRSSRPDAVPVRTEVDGNGTPDGDAARNGDGETSHGGNGNIPA
jgi:UDP-N-acetylglucosamine acyltransferase